MSGNTFGSNFTITTFGESHGEGIGVVIDGCPAGLTIDKEYIQKELDRRKPGKKDGQQSVAVTSRQEPDTVQILSGVFDGKATGQSIALYIQNTNQHSSDYSNIKDTFRPGHADYTFTAKYGFRDYRGGGRSSGRETAARVAAGAIAKEILKQKNISIKAWTTEVAGIKAETFDMEEITKNSFYCPDANAAKQIQQKLEEIRQNGDTAGAIVKCVVTGVPAGIGNPVFQKLDAMLSYAMLSIGAVKGIEFGSGFESAKMTGKEWNDEFFPEEEYTSNKNLSGKSPACSIKTNHAGGILGGISNGFPIEFNVAIKPVPSIIQEQNTIDSKGNPIKLKITGRHDVCLCSRIIPVIEAMCAITITDLILQDKISGNSL